ncbi:MAG: lysophospholipid acyltransferase family protein [Acidimicrobiales bacterium]
MAYWVVKILLTPLLRAVFRVSAEGTGNVPKRGPVILASNHRSFVDSVFLPVVVHRRVTFVAKAEYFESWKTAWFFRAVGMVPLKREGGSASARALAAAREDTVMAAIQKLSGQEMVGHYAKRDAGRFSAPGSEADPVPPGAPDEEAGSPAQAGAGRRMTAVCELGQRPSRACRTRSTEIWSPS